MKLSKIAFAVAGTLAIASGTAFAGQIGGSSTTYAKEGLTATVVVASPAKNYAFASDINAKTQSQKLQIQWTLPTGGQWNDTVIPSAYTALVPIVDVGLAGPRTGKNFAAYAAAANPAVIVPDDDKDLISINYVDEAGVTRDGFPAGTTISAFLTADKKALAFDINIPQGATPQYLIKTPRFQINGGTLAASNNVGITKLIDPVASPNSSTVYTTTDRGTNNTCVRPDQVVTINFKHFTNNTGTAVLQTGNSPDSEHLRGGSDTGNLVTLSQAINFTLTPNTLASRTSATSFNTQLINGTAAGAGITPGYGNFTVPGAGGFYAVAVPANETRHYAGTFKLVMNNTSALDTDGLTAYGVGANGVALEDIDYNTAAGLATVTTAGQKAGLIDHVAASTIATFKFANALPVGSKITLVEKAATGTVLAVSALTVAGQTTVDVKLPGAAQATNLALLATAGADLIVSFPGGAGLTIPQNGAFNIETILTKSQGTDGDQNNNCFMTSAGIGAGIKIDVRNYASSVKFPGNGNFASYVRLINNSESQTADIFAQMIYSDGTYGPYGKLPDLAPRAVANYDNKTLEGFMKFTPPTDSPFAASTQYTNTQGTTVVGNRGVAGTGDRVRFVSNTGTTLRIQSFMLLPGGTLLDTTNAQGVDFENSGDRVPANGLDAQPVSQDAINGLAK